MHTMATYHGGAGCPIDRHVDLHVEDTEATVTVLVAQKLLLPWEDWRQKVTPKNFYSAIRPS